MAEGTQQEPQAQRGYRLKLMHLIYMIIAMAAAIVVAFVAIAYLSPASHSASVGNGWNQVTATQPLMVNNKLYVAFMGIESCEYCAVERYAIFDALSNFGNWTYYGKQININTLPVQNLSTNPQSDAIFFKSSEGDWTLNFLASQLKYSSDYISFSSAEFSDNSGNQLQSPTPVQSGYLNKYDPGGSVPFTVIGGNFYEIGCTYSLCSGGRPVIFSQNGTGYNPDYIIASFNLTNSALHYAIQTEANYITALICFDINNAAPVCSSSAITAISSKL